MQDIAVVQKGPREHYLLAEAVMSLGRLDRLITDWYCPRLLQAAQSIHGPLPSPLRSAASSFSAAIPQAAVSSRNLRTIVDRFRLRRQPPDRGRSDQLVAASDSSFARWAASRLSHRQRVFLGYSYASLEALERAKELTQSRVLFQIDPGPCEFKIVRDEVAKYPEYSLGHGHSYPEASESRLRREWNLADVIVVNSQWSRRALESEGVPSHKLRVIPLAFEPTARTKDSLQSDNRGSRIRVLWLGQVNVRKGIHHLISAARQLRNVPVDFDVVGPIQIPTRAVERAPSSISFHGSVPRSEAMKWYRKADCFVLPTLSDGFAITQLEAMSYALPVVTTPCCGDVVDNGIDGFIVPSGDSTALANRLGQLASLPTREWLSMRAAAIDKSKSFRQRQFVDRLGELLEVL